MELEEPEKNKRELLEEKEKECLHAIKQDLCIWLSNLLAIDIQPESFLAQLDTGVLLCRVVSLIQEQARTQKDDTPKSSRMPLKEIQCNHKAKSDSFHARDNTANFISWCRAVGIEESVLFESNGLVLRNDERRIILCVLEVGRIAMHVGLKAPKLVELEKEIDSLENNNGEEMQESSAVEDKEVKNIEEATNKDEKKDGKPPKQKKRRRDSLESKVCIFYTT